MLWQREPRYYEALGQIRLTRKSKANLLESLFLDGKVHKKLAQFVALVAKDPKSQLNEVIFSKTTEV